MKKYHGIQMLRFLAASLVVVEHLVGNVLRLWGDGARYDVPSFGDIGVIVFFGISGFIMVTTQYDAFGSKSGAWDFFVRRLLRVLPIYAVATTLQYVNKMHFSSDYNFINYMKSLVFIPYIGDGGLYRPVLAQGWTLNLEMFFYLVFAFSLVFSRLRGILLSAAVFISLAVAHSVAKDLNLFFAFYADRILLFFVCGMLVALFKKRLDLQTDRLGLPILVCVSLIALATMFRILNGDQYRLAFNIGMVCTCVYLAASYQAAHYGKVVLFLERLGDASYSTYLFHGFVLGACKFLSSRIGEGQLLQLGVLAVFCVVLSNLVGYLAYRFVERPLAKHLRGWGPVRRPAAAP